MEPLLIRVLRGENCKEVPVWFMRQAGRYLPEYREIRARHSMLDVIRNPELAAEVTLQPLRRFPFDAAIIFADILNPLIGMGIELDFVKGEGPKIFNPVRSAEAVKKLVIPRPEDNVAYTLEALRRVKAEIQPQGKTLLGFSGAPLTLAAYMIEGAGSDDWSELKAFMRAEPRAFLELREKLTTLVADYLVAQVQAGADAVQLFDSWAQVLDRETYKNLALPAVREIVKNYRSRVRAPLIYFAPHAPHVFEFAAEIGAHAFSVDWKEDLSVVNNTLGGDYPLQGNLDPEILKSDLPRALSETQRILESGRALAGHIFNLGHGILPETPIAHVEKVVQAVKEFGRV